MHVSVGPVASESAIAYVKTTRGQIDEMRDQDRLPGTVTPELLDRFEDLHTEWEQMAAAGPEFHWVRDLDVEETEWLVHGFFRMVEAIAEQGGPPDELSEERRAFYYALVTGLLDALEHEGQANGEFAQHLRSFWPFIATP